MHHRLSCFQCISAISCPNRTLVIYYYETNLPLAKVSAVAYKLTQYCVGVGICLQDLDVRELAGFLSTSFSLVVLNYMKFVQDLSGWA